MLQNSNIVCNLSNINDELQLKHAEVEVFFYISSNKYNQYLLLNRIYLINVLYMCSGTKP